MQNKGFVDDAGVTNSTVADETQSQVHLADLDKTNDGAINGQEGVSESPVDKSSIPKPKENEKESTALFLPININEKDVDGQIQANGHTLYSPSTNKDEGDGNGDDDDGNEDDDDDLVCGVGSVTPGCLQRFMNIGYFTAFYSLAGLMTSALNVYISSQITTLEKYYNFSSSVSGFLMSCNDIGYLLTALLMSYYSRRVHIPRALSLSTFIFGVSGIMCVLAFVLTKDQYSSMTKFSSSHDNTTSARANQNSVANLCRNVSAASNISSQGDVPDAGGMSDGWKAFALSILAVGLCIQGIAKSPRHAFLGTYIDDNVPKTKTAKYLGIVGGLSIFGPAMAFMLGGIFSKIYVTLEDPGISVRDPRWVGAWWLGFLFFGGAAVVVAIPIFCFPRHLKGRRQIEGAEPQKKGVAEDEKKTTVVADDLKAFLQSGRRLLANPVYVLVVLATGINMTGIAGYMAFAAKYFETQFTVSVFQANTTLGSLNVLSAALGTVIGGFLVSRRKMSPKACIKFNLACSTISLLSMSLCFFLGCEQPHIHPVDDTLV
ncbi:hypothetical protein RRG08_001846 [Elysia crispata]|uniref:Solute carrier organic anion transporter family member n=1 Tax=Elysia crispata TaxID=231223 RepID=A0AAE0YFD4_9GAST|nr:hypothetical protein RRG08_001846 [Elysia crispata]